jgi:lysophospholipase L1-like esterase
MTLPKANGPKWFDIDPDELETIIETKTDFAAQLAEKSQQTYNDFYFESKNKKIVIVGDSTTGAAPALWDRINYYCNPGRLLEGVYAVNYGCSGNTLNNFINDIAANGQTLSKAIAEQARLYIISYGINDIRAGADSPGRNKAQITADLKTCIDRILNETGAYILLRTPNPFLSSDPGGYGWVSPLSNAQFYSDVLYEIYESFRGYDRRLDVIDIPSLVFGKKCLDVHPYMLNQLHPNDSGYMAIADELAEHISQYRKDLKTGNEDIILKGTIQSINGNYIVFTTLSDEEINIGDVVYLGNGTSFVVNAEPMVYGTTRMVPFSGVDVTTYGVLYVIRSKKAQVETSPSKNWLEALATKTSISPFYIKADINISTYNFAETPIWGGCSFKYYTENTNINQMQAQFWCNNDSSTITGGTHDDLDPVTVVLSETSKFENSIFFNTHSNQYLHLLLKANVTATGNLNIEFGDIKLSLNGINIDLSSVTWVIYLPEAGDTLTPNFGRDIPMTYNSLITVLKDKGLIS